MLPSFLSLNGGVAGAPVEVPPPPYFQAPLLPIKAATLGGWTRTSTGITPAQKAGLRFERRVHVELRSLWGYKYHESQRIDFEDQRGRSACLPDGLIKELGCLVIVEVKSQHMPESWWQLRKKYEPLVRFIWPGQRVLLLEICRSLDVSMPYPEKFEIVENIGKFIEEAADGALGVLQWKL